MSAGAGPSGRRASGRNLSGSNRCSLSLPSAARLKEAGQPFVIDAAIAKLRASEVAEKVSSLCIKYVATLGPISA